MDTKKGNNVLMSSNIKKRAVEKKLSVFFVILTSVEIL